MTIYLHVGGRLGNQLFQWAYSHSLKDKYRVTITPTIDFIHHDYSDSVSIKSTFSCKHINEVMRKDSLGVLLALLDRLGPGPIHKYLCSTLKIHRTLNSFELPTLFNETPRIVTGFFINARVLESREEFIASELNEKMKKVSSISQLPSRYQLVHVRRGDYVNYVHSYGLLDASYYQENLLPNLPIVLSTDSEEDSLSVIKAIKPDFILGPRDANPWQVLRVFSEASHVVMANSTLSWWGGFLAAQNGSSVVQPAPFFRSVASYSNQLNYRLFSARPSTFLATTSLD